MHERYMCMCRVRLHECQGKKEREGARRRRSRVKKSGASVEVTMQLYSLDQLVSAVSIQHSPVRGTSEYMFCSL